MKLYPSTQLKATEEQGSIVVTLLILMAFSASMILSVGVLTTANLFRSTGRVYQLQAQYSAESGADAAIAELNNGVSFTGTTSDVRVLSTAQELSTFSTTVTGGSSANQEIIVSTGKVYVPANAAKPTYTRKIRVTASRSSTQSATAVMSRNIIEVASGVKNIFATSIFANGYIDMSKNTTNLVAENITVAGKNTGASDCSIGGSGNLVKPSSFTTPGQTQTNITLAYNNCITPPGNTSNSSFNVSANNGTVTPIASTYVPWSQYMDSSYQNSPGGCSDWTAAGPTVQIPSTGNTKKTQYPDSGSNVSTSCGTSGDLELGSNTYVLNNNVHVRANFCNNGCQPTFNNPSSSPVYVFIEGDINFTAVTTSPGSGPIIFIAYGADPASLTGSCPDGGSIYLGQKGSSSDDAPAAYFLATNGICLSGTKYSATPALGGIGGKNIYVATSPGTPFDLDLNSSFPYTSIPVNLTWKATGYERL